jgi:hypothetical protein
MASFPHTSPSVHRPSRLLAEALPGGNRDKIPIASDQNEQRPQGGHAAAEHEGVGRRCARMGSLTKFVGYTAVVGGVSLVLIYGAIWLASPDLTLKAEARAAPLSPRIAESIERKKDAIPRAEPAEVKRPEPMTVANVALTPSLLPTPTPKREAARHRAKIKHVANPNVAPREIAPDAAAPRPVVTITRSDFPY